MMQESATMKVEGSSKASHELPTRASFRNMRMSSARLSPDPDVQAHRDIEFDEEECAVTSERLRQARSSVLFRDPSSCLLTAGETQDLHREQRMIRQSFYLPSFGAHGSAPEAPWIDIEGGGSAVASEPLTARDKMDLYLEQMSEPDAPRDRGEGLNNSRQSVSNPRHSRHSVRTVKAQFMMAKIRAWSDKDKDGVLGVISKRGGRKNSMMGTNKFKMYQLKMVAQGSGLDLQSFGISDDDAKEDGNEEAWGVNVEDISYVRKPNMARIFDEYVAMQHHPKYTLRQVVMSRRFHLYAHRFANAQYQQTLVYPTLKQPPELYSCPWLENMEICGRVGGGEPEPVTEKWRTRAGGHRFIIAADSQFGILMDGFAMEIPNWTQEIEISRRCVEQINAMRGKDRPLYVCVCGDLVDTESSFSGAIASWKKVMSGWERNLIFEQQVKDFKRVWAGLAPDIALVCQCGNHDVGNRPTRASISRWTSSFGDDYLSFWVNGTFNICLNNCLFNNPSGAPDLFDEQLQWMEEKLAYARENDATHIFVYGHYPWFLKHEEEADDYLTSYSSAPAGWGPPGSSFADSYFTIPYEFRKVAMKLFRKYDVTACFSGHFHQNVTAKASWGMHMIVTGPLSMNLHSEIGHELSNGETNGIGMRIVDVGERGEFTHRWKLLDEEEDIYERALERCIKSMEHLDELENEEEEEPRKNSFLDDIFSEIEVSPLEAMQWNTSMSVVDENFDNLT